MAEIRNRFPVDVHRFASAAPEDDHVYGACCPGWHSTTTYGDSVDKWIGFMTDRGIDRVCCLLSGEQIGGFGTDERPYVDHFGRTNVLYAPIADHHLADVSMLESDVLPFIDDTVSNGERVVVHCLAGIGRTGHVLAAWLVYGHDYDPVGAIETVEKMGRSPTDAVRSGTARHGELYELLAEFV